MNNACLWKSLLQIKYYTLTCIDCPSNVRWLGWEQQQASRRQSFRYLPTTKTQVIPNARARQNNKTTTLVRPDASIEYFNKNSGTTLLRLDFRKQLLIIISGMRLVSSRTFAPIPTTFLALSKRDTKFITTNTNHHHLLQN